jgi:small-conductance mechanosensitive channel
LKKITEKCLVENKRYDIKCVFGLKREEMSKIGWGSKEYGGSGEGIHLKRCDYEYDIKDIKEICNSGWSKILLETFEEKEKAEKEFEKKEKEYKDELEQKEKEIKELKKTTEELKETKEELKETTEELKETKEELGKTEKELGEKELGKKKKIK